jgi:hypothetical protein
MRTTGRFGLFRRFFLWWLARVNQIRTLNAHRPVVHGKDRLCATNRYTLP